MRRGSPCPIAVVMVALALCAAPPPASAAPFQESARDILENAVRLLRDGEALDALMQIERALTRDPDLWEAHVWQGRALQALGDDLGARDAFLRATEIAPGTAEAHFLAGAASLRVADFEVAWDQAIAAAQGGQAEAGRLLDALAEVDRPPEDLQERLRGPRIQVTAGPDVPADLQRLVRQAVVEAPRLGLVLGAAEHRVELRASREALAVRLLDAADAVLLERRVETRAGDVADRLSELMAQIEATLGEGDS